MWSSASFTERWIDFYPSEGKRSGAYSNGGAYDVHPYMLLNYLGQYNDVSTLAHEIGHTMHSYLLERDAAVCDGELPDLRRRSGVDVQRGAADRSHAGADQGHADAALAARQLPREHQVHRVPPDAVRRVRAAHARDGAEGRAAHRRGLDKLYLDITRRYYGHEAGVCVVDDYVAHEWSFIPHFYSDFYVFQYATSFTAAEALSAKVLAGDEEATRRYLTFLSAGGSKYPIDLLRDAGVDMTTDEPLTLTMAKMNGVMDEIEAVLDAETCSCAGTATECSCPKPRARARWRTRPSVADVQRRVDFDQVEREQPSRVGDDFHQHVRLAVVEAALDRRADAGRDDRVARVEVERDVDAAGAGRRDGNARSAMRAMPSRSMSFIVNTCTPTARIRAFSRSSRLRMPSSTVCSALTAGSARTRPAPAAPVRAAPPAASRARCR